MHDVPPAARPDPGVPPAPAALPIPPRYDLLKQQHASGVRWFYCIAALTVINSLLIVSLRVPEPSPGGGLPTDAEVIAYAQRLDARLQPYVCA